MASGHIKYIFAEDDSVLKHVFRVMPMRVQQHAPGITFSQAVVKMTDDYNKDVENLEQLLKIQRNKPMRSQTLGLIGIRRSRQTGLPSTDYKEVKGKMEYLDAAANAKYFNPANSKTERNYDKIRSKTVPDYEKRPLLINLDKKGGNNDWIAVIHIDGNGLGTVVEEVCKHGADKFKTFSADLDDAVKNSAKAALIAVKDYFEGEKIIPIRPIILSGEDYNLICRADFAVEYVQAFLKAFEDNSKFVSEYVPGKANLTACAGIAFVKSSFPFYYAYNLANGLCEFAKKQSERQASCLMFHKVQDSFTENYDEIVERELTPKEGLSWQYGPYFYKKQDGYLTIGELITMSNHLLNKDGNAVKSHLRQWLSLMHYDTNVAKHKVDRVLSMIGEKSNTAKKLKDLVSELTKAQPRKIEDKNLLVYPVYDILALHSVKYQDTKKLFKFF